MEAHKEHLKILCRVCCKRPKGYVHKKISEACQSLLSSELGIVDVLSESEDIQKQEGVIRATNLTLHVWQPHVQYHKALGVNLREERLLWISNGDQTVKITPGPFF